MVKRIGIAAAVLLVATLGWPALPAWADKGTGCVNVTTYLEPTSSFPDGVPIARTCIAWDDDPAGDNWTSYQTKVWNPPGIGPPLILVTVYFNDGTRATVDHLVEDGETYKLDPNHVGPYTVHYEIAGTLLSHRYCEYMVPRSSEQVSHSCPD